MAYCQYVQENLRSIVQFVVSSRSSQSRSISFSIEAAALQGFAEVFPRPVVQNQCA